MYDNTLESFEFRDIVFDYSEETMAGSDFLVRMSLWIPMKKPAFMVPFPMNKPSS